MARSRNIKPSFFMNDELGALSPVTRLLFIGLWTIADFKGCVEFRPARIKAQLMPWDDCDVEKLAINLERSGFVRLYSVAGKKYLKIVNFDKHQNPHKNEREQGSEIPDAPESTTQAIENKELTIYPDKNGTTPESDGTARADSLNLIPDSLLLVKDNTSVADAPVVEKKSPRIASKNLTDAMPGLSESVASDFLSHRKSKKAPLTETAIRQIAKEVSISRWPPDRALTEVMVRGWVGFKAAWVENDNGKNGAGNHQGTERLSTVERHSRQCEEYIAAIDAREQSERNGTARLAVVATNG